MDTGSGIFLLNLIQDGYVTAQPLVIPVPFVRNPRTKDSCKPPGISVDYKEREA